MNEKCINFVVNFTELNPFFKSSVVNIDNAWAPQETPIIILFAELGRALLKEYPGLDVHTKLLVFNLIEDSFVTPDVALKTAVATGLLEALAFSSYSDKTLYNSIINNLGEKSKSHICTIMAS